MVQICPEKGLTQQHFRCACCNRAFNKQPTEARLCDYSGLYYCPACHQRDLAIIPARVLRNWDFTPRKVPHTQTLNLKLNDVSVLSAASQVCCQCSDLLGRYFSRPLLRVQEVNPLLYTYVQDLVTVEVRGHHCVCMCLWCDVYTLSAGSPTGHPVHEAVLCSV